MSGFTGNQETTNYWLTHALDPNPLIINGWNYIGTPSDETILGADYRTQYRSNASGNFTDIQYGNDTLSGADGNDYIDGGTGLDSISGGNGLDTMTGGGDNDFVHGNAGNDHVEGGNGGDTVRGGQGDDTLSGGAGADYTSGDAGNDVIYGGADADTFNFSTGFGADVAADFNRSEGDSVRIEAGSYTLSQAGANTIITMSDGSTLTVLNTTYGSLDSGWIHS